MDRGKLGRIKEWIYWNREYLISLGIVLLVVIGIIGFNWIEKQEEAKKLEEKKIEERIAEEKKLKEEKKKEAEEQKEEKKEVVIDVKPPQIAEEKKETGSGTFTLFILGLDTRKNEFKGRSDTILVMAANKETGNVKLLSIPRDSYVRIAGKGKYDKITHAYAYGNIPMAKETVEDLLGIKMDYYVVFNFYSFMKIVDTLGGVDVQVPFDFVSETHTGKEIRFHKGLQHLNGEEALAYVRMRKKDPLGDIGRGEREKQVIRAVMGKAMQIRDMGEISNLYNVINKTVKTNIGFMDMMKLYPYVDTLKNMENLQLKGTGKKINGIYYYQLDEGSLQQVREMLHRQLQG